MVRIVQVGLGPWGLDWARQVLPAVNAVSVVGRVDVDEDGWAEAAQTLCEPVSHYHPTLAAALTAIDADAVLVTVPLAAHLSIVQEALAAGKHVLVEKPFTETVAEAMALADLAEAGNRVLMVSQNYRHFPAPLAASGIVADGRFGALLNVDVAFRHNAAALDYRYYHLAQPLLGDLSIHHFDLMRMVIGAEPQTVSCRTWTEDGSRFVGPPAAEVEMEFSGGVQVSYAGSWISDDTPSAWAGEWAMTFEHADIWWTGRGSEGERFARDRLIVRESNVAVAKVELKVPPYFDRAGCLSAFAEAVTTGRQPPHFSSARDNVGSIALVEAAVRSADAGRPVALSELFAGAGVD